MAASTFVALDLGAESGRAMLGTLDGSRLTLQEKYRFANPTGRIGQHYYWDLLAQWEHIKAGLRKAGDSVKLAGIGIDTWGVDFGLLGRNGEILGLPHMYRDPQTDGIVERAFARVPRERVFEATGIQVIQLNSLYQLLAMRLRRAPALDAAEKLLFMPDLFNFLLTGQAKNEFSIATTSQMYDPRRRAWAVEMLRELDLPAHLLQEVIPSGTLLGAMKDDVASQCGIAPAPVIAPGTHDTASAVAAVPAQCADPARPDWCYISSGTWSLMGVEVEQPVINEKTLKYNYTNEGGVAGRIRLLRNIMGLWLVQECRRHWAAEGREYSYADLARMAAEAKPFASLVDPGHAPFFAPGGMPGKIARFCQKTGQPAPAGPAQFVRACLESLALAYRRTLEGLQDILGRKLSVIHIVGGGGQNELLNQMTADACGCTVVTGPVEATAAGNILTQAMAVGLIRDLAHLRAIVRDSFEVKRYQPADTQPWQRAYERYCGILE